METASIKDLETKLLYFKSKLDEEVTFQSARLSFVPNNGINSERYERLVNITGIKAPLLLACKHSGFFDNVDKPDHTDQTVDYIRPRKKRVDSKNSTQSSGQDQNSFCGSPLKLEVIADLSLFEEGDSPAFVKRGVKKNVDFGLGQREVKNLISLYSVLLTSTTRETSSEDKSSLPTVLALCDGQNMKSVSAQGLKPLVDTQNNLLGVTLVETQSKPSLEKSQHMKMVPSFPSSDITCRAKYDVLAEGDDKLLPDVHSCIQVVFEWRESVGKSLVLLHEPPMKAAAMVKIQRSSGSSDSPLFHMYQELEILRCVIEGLTTTEVNWIGTQEQPLLEATQELVEKLKLGSDLVESRLGETTASSSTVVDGDGADLLLMEERKDLDFTDHLWKILQTCTSYTDLIETFKYIVSELRRGEFQPFIHVYNTTTLGQMVKDSYRGQLRAPVMTGLSPLQYLAEIGIQKLTQDYIHMFLSKNLANLGMLEYYLKGNLELDEKWTRLSKLHNTMETVIMLKQILHLKAPQEILSKSSRQMLKHYETHAVNNSYQFGFDIPTASLRNVIEKFEPSEWFAEGVRMVEGEEERLVYHLSSEQPFDWVKLKPVGSSKTGSSGDMEEETSYFLTIVRESVSILA